MAVDHVSFTVEKGEVVGLLGPNGAGKTTTMRMLTGFLPASSGTAEVGGYDVVRDSLEVRKRIGYLPESVPLYREHRVREMMAFQARLHRMPRAEAKRRIPEVLERVGVRDRERSLVGNLSRGLRQRVGLAVALLPKPEVLVLDEPTSGLDPLQRIEVRKLVQELAEEHTLLVSSHILPEIEAVCPRVIIIAKGKVAAQGTQAELVREHAGGAHVRFEAMVGDAAEAARLIGTLAGVEEVVDEGRLGIHHQFVIRTREDLREDVGALAMTKGWAIRELSWQQPTLEQLFARVALELGEQEPLVSAPLESAAEPEAVPSSGLVELGAAPIELPASPAPEPAASSKIVYNLNPFDMGASRELGQPKAVEAPAPPPEGSPAAGVGYQSLNPFEHKAPSSEGSDPPASEEDASKDEASGDDSSEADA